MKKTIQDNTYHELSRFEISVAFGMLSQSKAIPDDVSALKSWPEVTHLFGHVEGAIAFLEEWWSDQKLLPKTVHVHPELRRRPQVAEVYYISSKT